MPPVPIDLTDADVELARSIAVDRLDNPRRHQSVHRPTARNLRSQYRGAAGEIAAARWLRGLGFTTREGYRDDAVCVADISVGRHGFEVMTAKVRDRQRTGFCVPPAKLATARRRGILAYLFVGTGSEPEPRRLLIQAACRVSDVDLDPARDTWVTDPAHAVRNFVVRREMLRFPDDFLAEITDA